MKAQQIVGLVLGLVIYVAADVYMHNPRGSNNRLNEANTNRANNNRLFDSQNNAKGGYCYGPALKYYEGSQLTIEWASQHGCGNPKQLCVIVLQYMCTLMNDDPNIVIRDGATTTSPPNDATQIQETDDNAIDGMGYKYGMHENYYYYQWCRTRTRNQGLYIADRNVNNNAGAAATRQNNNGGQSGMECPEERDYYPYWHPAPWKDIAVLTDDTTLCDLFQKESQNVKAKGYCYDPTKNTGIPYADNSAQNNPTTCNQAGLVWAEQPSWGIAKPDCVKNMFVRDNHLGNGINGYNAHYNWTMPTAKTESCIKDNNCNCVLRLRYNISTTDFEGYKVPFADAKVNGKNAAPLTQDPDMGAYDDCPPDDADTGIPCNVTLAIDTSQFARTFQDRSYIFHLSPRPSKVGGGRIFNLNVKGKRGNIVQAYPSTEYDFHPNDLHVRVGDYIHFQWTGCDTNPAGNAGEGTDGTDRSNMVQIENLDASTPARASFIKKHPLFESTFLRNRMAFLDQNECKSYDALQGTNKDQDVENCMNLNKAEQYFDGGLIKMNKTGTFYYMSTRNNNFTNRGQKGTLTVNAVLPAWGIALVSVGAGVFVLSMGAGAAMIYAKANPHSAISNYLSKM